MSTREGNPMTLEDRIAAALAGALTDEEFAQSEADWENAE